METAHIEYIFQNVQQSLNARFVWLTMMERHLPNKKGNVNRVTSCDIPASLLDGAST